SILNMLKRIDVNIIASNLKIEIENADKLILPGVGAFDYGMEMLEKSGFKELVINHALVKKKPILGICLGMQMLGKKSQEGIKDGLNLIPFESKKFKFDNNLKVPHMGWDISDITIKNDPIFKGIMEEQRYYFVHSYHAVCDEEKYELMSCEYGYKFS
ncbi:MAG: imidazole glycerol phosphate synthase subunit HisH, partial [Cetobacterium sp.]